jgi:hypothetical protein
MINKKTAYANWQKAVKMVQWNEDRITLCEDRSDLPYLEKEEKIWNKKAREYRAIYLMTK